MVVQEGDYPFLCCCKLEKVIHVGVMLLCARCKTFPQPAELRRFFAALDHLLPVDTPDDVCLSVLVDAGSDE